MKSPPKCQVAMSRRALAHCSDEVHQGYHLGTFRTRNDKEKNNGTQGRFLPCLSEVEVLGARASGEFTS